MAITLHCQHCGKKIEASEKAAGKWGKCPSCHNKVYVPDLSAGEEEIRLVPIDQEEIEKKQKLMAETYELTQNILQEKEINDNNGNEIVEHIKIPKKQLEKNLVNYIRQMSEGELGEAEEILRTIIPYKQQAINILDKIALSDMPEPGLEKIPQQVLAGLIRDLRSKIS
jgi:phage FluMu protein Com